MGIYPEGAFSKKVRSKSRLDKGEKEVPTEGKPLKPRFDRGEIAKNQITYYDIIIKTLELGWREFNLRYSRHRRAPCRRCPLACPHGCAAGCAAPLTSALAATAPRPLPRVVATYQPQRRLSRLAIVPMLGSRARVNP
jgi:hypothetical protein